jgi:hypothetical protein
MSINLPEFVDSSIRNAVISNFNPLEIRDDAGKL